MVRYIHTCVPAFLQWDPENCEIIGRRLLNSSFDFSSMNIKHNNVVVAKEQDSDDEQIDKE